jgi:V/A-type H+-transporting ATPase subunit A
MIQGEVIRVSGPVVHAGGLRGSKMYDVVRVGEEALTGEVIRLDQDVAVVQVYEDTTGLRTGEIVENTGEPLRVELGPGLLASIYDGVQRPLPLLAERSGDFISRGLTVPGIDHGKRWDFVPEVRAGAEVGPGDVLGTVREYHLDHRVLVPPGMGGTVENIADGSLTIDDEVARLNGDRPIRMGQTWPVRGSTSSGNSERTSVISLPRSPQPM